MLSDNFRSGQNNSEKSDTSMTSKPQRLSLLPISDSIKSEQFRDSLLLTVHTESKSFGKTKGSKVM